MAASAAATTEVQLQLDRNGRTTWIHEDSDSIGDKAQQSDADVNYSTETVKTCLSTINNDSSGDAGRRWMDNLLFDCEIADCGLMPRTFWMPVDGSLAPRCALEQYALDVFHHHVPQGYSYNPKTSGAEWWVQLRPSPEKTGRYSMFMPNQHEEDMSTNGISFHWDKDEDLRLLAGGSLYVHPHVSTVTYLTSLGAPTLILDKRIHPLTGEWVSEPGATPVEGFVCWPWQGKHVCFDGRFLHAAPPDLMPSGRWKEQCTISNVENDPSLHKSQERRHRRVTFLVNVWLNHKPFHVTPFPETMTDKMSKVDASSPYSNLFVNNSNPENTEDKCVVIDEGKVQNERLDSDDTKAESTKKVVWPVGDYESNETIHVQVPMQSIQNEASRGGNIRLRWKPGYQVRLLKNDLQANENETNTTDGDGVACVPDRQQQE